MVQHFLYRKRQPHQKQLGILIQIGLINYTLLLLEFTLASSYLVQCTPV